MEEYETTRCSFDNYCKKCSWISINHPRISKITRITDNCSTFQNVVSKEVRVFYNGNRSTNYYHGERCCYGERTVYFIAENSTERRIPSHTLTTDGGGTTRHLPVTSESHDKVPDIVTRTTSKGQSTIWLPVMLGSVGFLLIFLAFYILCRMRGQRKPKKIISENKTYSCDTVVPQDSTAEYSTIEETEELHVYINKTIDNYFILEQIGHDEGNTTQNSEYDSHKYIYNALFEKSEPTESDVDLYNHVDESDYVYNHTNDTERSDRQIENADYSCTLRIADLIQIAT